MKGSLKLPYKNPGRPSLFLLWHVKVVFTGSSGSYSDTVIIRFSNSAELWQISFVIMFRHFNLYFEACCLFKKNYKKELLISKRERNIMMENIAEIPVNANLKIVNLLSFVSAGSFSSNPNCETNITCSLVLEFLVTRHRFQVNAS